MSDEYTAREAWDTFGSGYDQAFGASFSAIAEAALRFADIRPGLTLLDVAAGSGALFIFSAWPLLLPRPRWAQRGWAGMSI